MYKTIGILGGMGPAATADLMMKITNMTDAKNDQDHIHLVIDSDPSIPDRTEALLHGGDSPVPALLLSARRLESMGADFIVVACNTAHCFLPEIEYQINTPIINMPVETALYLSKRKKEKVAILGTTGTIQSGLYQRTLGGEGIEVIYPTEAQQAVLMSLIYDYIKKGITDPVSLPHEEVKAIVDDLRMLGAQALVLACTELPIGFDLMSIKDDDCVDPTTILAEAAIIKTGAKVRSEK